MTTVDRTDFVEQGAGKQKELYDALTKALHLTRRAHQAQIALDEARDVYAIASTEARAAREHLFVLLSEAGIHTPAE